MSYQLSILDQQYRTEVVKLLGDAANGTADNDDVLEKLEELESEIEKLEELEDGVLGKLEELESEIDQINKKIN